MKEERSMPPDNNDAANPKAWLRIANSDLALARMAGMSDVIMEAFCFHAQQCVEKAIKGVLVSKNITFPYTHNITHLITLLQANDLDFPETLFDAARLSEYATSYRYPGTWGSVTSLEFELALSLAQQVYDWAMAIVAP
jgi:HEPN domain-containing protein